MKQWTRGYDNPLKYFAALHDPRVERSREHLLEEILLISIAAVLSGTESWNDIADYGLDKQEWLKTFLQLPGGIPSRDTFNRVFSALDPEEVERGFAAWVSSIAKLTAGEVVALDGKTLCSTSEAFGIQNGSARKTLSDPKSQVSMCLQRAAKAILSLGKNMIGADDSIRLWTKHSPGTVTKFPDYCPLKEVVFDQEAGAFRVYEVTFR